MTPKMRLPAVLCQRWACYGVTSIEYALIASLIAIAIIVGVRATGEANALSWANWTGQVLDAVKGH